MLFKLILKIWPSLIPIIAYIFWTYIVERIIIKAIFKKGKILNTKKEKKEYVIETPGVFSLRNQRFVVVLYFSLILAIVTLIYFALS